jgi:hypothetical protein
MTRLCIVVAVVACGGAAGVPGPVGPQGLSGVAGDPGAPGVVLSAAFCEGQSSAIGGLALRYQYQVVAYSTGDKLIMCSITDETRETSSAAYCRYGFPCQTGSKCVVSYDVDTPSSGVFSFRTESRRRSPFSTATTPARGTTRP